MYVIKTLNKIAQVGLNRLDGKNFAVKDSDAPHGVLVRSAQIAPESLNPELLAIARAGAGVNNIPVAECAERGIVVFNTPGANANAVRELTICALLLASRSVTEGIAWAKGLSGDDVPAQVEKGKSKFVGPELEGKTLGVVGLGAIGVKVANAARHLGMDVIGYDPFISVNAAWNLSRSIKRAADMKSLTAQADYITFHMPFNKETKHMVNAEFLAGCKDGVRLVNLARGELVSDADMLAALASGKAARYVTDFPNAALLASPGVIPIPHLGASTPESEDNCAVMAADELSDYLANGNIKNSVNFPDAELPPFKGVRLCVLHKNIPNVLAQVSAVFGNAGLNIDNMVNRSRGEFAYTLLDSSSDASSGAVEALKSVKGVIRVRVLHI